MSSTTLPSEDALKDTLMKLLNKAGSDPRATPRMLRSKAEERLKLAKDTLKPKREDIKKIIMNWHDSRWQRLGEDIKLLVKLTKAAGIGPKLFEDLRQLTDRDEQKILLVKRLKEKGLKFSDPPTEDEIAAAKQESEKRKDLEGIDTQNIVESKRRSSDSDKSSRKRSAEASEDDEKNGSETLVVKSERGKRKKFDDEDEEAQF